MATFAMVTVNAQELPEPTEGEEWCVRTQGFWKNHSDEWPAFTDIGVGLFYFAGAAQDELIGELKQPVRKDVTLILIKQVIAAQLNVLKAPSLANYVVDGEMVGDLIGRADPALINGDFDWLVIESVKDKLDTFNNSEVCAPTGSNGGDLPPA
jgi:hypothetical protein